MRKNLFFWAISLGVGLAAMSSQVYATSSVQCSNLWENYLADHTLLPIYNDLKNHCDFELSTTLRKIISVNKRLDYKEARKILFSNIYQENGYVKCIYTFTPVKTTTIPKETIMNTEHLWPQSLGAEGIAKSDLHHLTPAMADVNSRRGNHPFCIVQKASWTSPDSGAKFGKSAKGTTCFEPPDENKGNIARALFYFSVRYDFRIAEEQENFLRQWHEQDPVDDLEIERSAAIEQVQNNHNPFIDHPELVSFTTDF